MPIPHQNAVKPAILDSVPRREIVAVLLWTLLADLLIFRTLGFSGPAAFFAMAPALFFIGRKTAIQNWAGRITIGLIWIVAMRLVWAGSGWTIASGVALLFGLSMSVAGYVPYVLEGFAFAARVIFDGGSRLASYPLPGGMRRAIRSHGQTFAWLLPIVAATAFGSIFVFANPNLLERVWEGIDRFADHVFAWLQGVSFWEVPFCCFALLLGAGMIRPALPMLRIGPTDDDACSIQSKTSPMYAAYRNTLATLILLFSIYLVFEFATLWKHDFPAGFYYAGYAHQGAAWLTVALALATAILSAVFSGSMRHDNRVSKLRTFAWIWSFQNMLLAVAVYNRLMIYVGYNGMTRLRMIGFFGITAVVIGFLLVLVAMRRNKGFWWLIRSQMIALMLTTIVYTVVPVDYIVHRYNVAQINDGHTHPSVMIAVKKIDDEGILPLLELTECEDAVIRDGVRAILAERQIATSPAFTRMLIQADRSSVRSRSNSRQPTQRFARHWTQFQGSTYLLQQRLAANQAKWAEFQDPVARADALQAFKVYAMQWY